MSRSRATMTCSPKLELAGKRLRSRTPKKTQQCPNSRIAVLWDGASYHRSQEVRAYLASVNQGLEESERKLTCIRFAPNAPEQNPIEDIWLCAKRFIRECYHLCKSFAAVKYLFEFVTHCQIFDFPKLFTYGNFSQLI